MKSKLQKQEEVAQGKELMNASNALIFVDFAKVKTKDLVKLRRELKKSGNPLLVMKKRLFELIFKEKGMAYDLKNFKTSMGAVFVSNIESAASSVYKFFKALEKEKKIDPAAAGVKILGGYDIAAAKPLEAKQVIFIGQLPPREVLLAQLLGLLAAPIKSFLYVLDTKAKQMVESK